MQQQTIPELVTAATAGAMFDTHPGTIRRWCHDGRINAFGYGKRYLRVSPDEIRDMLKGKPVKLL